MPDDLASLVAGQPLSHVLIVDDSQMVRKMLRRLLGMVWSDAEVLEAEDGLAALEIVASQKVSRSFCGSPTRPNNYGKL